MTGFTAQEEQLGRMVTEAVRRGVPESAFGLGGRRTVGPMVTLIVEDRRATYRVNAENGITLGRTVSEARASIRRIYADWLVSRAPLPTFAE